MAKLTAAEAAKLIGVSRQTIHRWRKSRDLSYIEKTDQGFLYDPAEVIRVAQNKNITLPNVTSNTPQNNNKLQHATAEVQEDKSNRRTVTPLKDNVTSNTTQSNSKLQHATAGVTATLQEKITKLTQEKTEIKLKEALAQKEIELLREQIEEIKKDKDRIFSLVEKNTLLLEHVQEENKNLKQQVTEATIKKKKWWLF